MRVTEDFSPAKDGKSLLIELSGMDIVKHIESDFERTARLVYEKSKSIADLLLWLSEWANTENL